MEMLDVKRDITSYWHLRSETYDCFPATKQEMDERDAYKVILTRHLGEMDLDILDVGAGTGFLSMTLAEMGHRMTAFDMTEGMLEKARQKAAVCGIPMDFVIGDAECLPFDEGTFDAVVCRWVLWTLPRPELALSQWLRVLKPGGVLLCIDGLWSYESLPGRVKKLFRRAGIRLYEKRDPQELGYTQEINRYLPYAQGISRESMTQLFDKAGFSSISSEKLSQIRKIRARNMRLLYRLSLSPATSLVKGHKEILHK